MRLKYILIGVAVVILIPLAWGAWWFLSPLLIDKTVDEAFPYAANAVIPADMTMAQVNQKMAEQREVIETVTEPMPPEMAAPTTPTLLQSGQFEDADSFHKGSGLAEIFETPDGSLLLRLEDFKVTNGPDLHVILTPPPPRAEKTSRRRVTWTWAAWSSTVCPSTSSSAWPL